MKYIELTQGMRTMVDDDLFDWLNQIKWYYRKRSGTRPGGDVVHTMHGYDDDHHVKSQTLYMAALILPVPPGFVVDHSDCNPLNNQRSNLRRATNRQNVLNAGRRSTNSTGVKGVHWSESKQRFVAQTSVDGKKKWIGDFRILDDAAKAYADFVVRVHGPFARID